MALRGMRRQDAHPLLHEGWCKRRHVALFQPRGCQERVGSERLRRLRTAYRAAATAGRESGYCTKDRWQTARALTNLGNAMRGWGRAPQEIEMAYRDAAAAGRASGTPEGIRRRRHGH